MNRTMLAIDSSFDGGECDDFVSALISLTAGIGDLVGALRRPFRAMDDNKSLV